MEKLNLYDEGQLEKPMKVQEEEAASAANVDVEEVQ